MNFIEYLAELQNKYNITNKEIREELSQSGKPVSKSYLSHKLSGERRITEDEFNLIVHTIRPTAAEEKKLRAVKDATCSPDDGLLQSLKRLLGDGNVALK